MRKIDVADRNEIKRLLYSSLVLGVKDDSFSSFGGFQLWWYDREHNVCGCCQSGWSQSRKKVQHCSLDKATKILWQNRGALFLRGKQLTQDAKLMALKEM